MSETPVTSTTEIPVNKAMFVFDIKNNTSQATGISKVAHEDCFREQYKLPANYSVKVDREITGVPRATCEFCGLRLDPVAAEREEAAIKKWLETGDRTDYTNIITERNKRDGVAKRQPIAAKTKFGTSFSYPETEPRSNVQAVREKLRGVSATGVKSGDVTIVTQQEKSISDMSRMTDEELFSKE